MKPFEKRTSVYYSLQKLPSAGGVQFIGYGKYKKYGKGKPDLLSCNSFFSLKISFHDGINFQLLSFLQIFTETL